MTGSGDGNLLRLLDLIRRVNSYPLRVKSRISVTSSKKESVNPKKIDSGLGTNTSKGDLPRNTGEMGGFVLGFQKFLLGCTVLGALATSPSLSLAATCPVMNVTPATACAIGAVHKDLHPHGLSGDSNWPEFAMHLGKFGNSLSFGRADELGGNLPQGRNGPAGLQLAGQVLNMLSTKGLSNQGTQVAAQILSTLSPKGPTTDSNEDPPGEHLQAPVSTVPLPGALSLFASGLIGLGLIARRRRQSFGS